MNFMVSHMLYVYIPKKGNLEIIFLIKMLTLKEREIHRTDKDVSTQCYNGGVRFLIAWVKQASADV